MTDLDNFNTVQHYAAWSFPCYRKFNCPKRHIIVDKTEPPPGNENGQMLGFSIDQVEQPLAFVFLVVCTVITFMGCCFICGILFANRGARRPYNQLLISILSTDLLMTIIVMPMHTYDLALSFIAQNNGTQIEEPITSASGSDSTSVSGSLVSCKTQLFTHLLVITVRSWSIASFVLLHHLNDSVIPTLQSVLVVISVWIGSGLIVLPTIVFKDSLVDFNECTMIPNHYGMVIYVVTMVFILPTCILTPVFFKLSHINSQFALRKDISADFLDQDDEETDNPYDIFEVVHSESPDDISEEGGDDNQSRCKHLATTTSENQSLDSVEFRKRTSQATLEFLKTDSNLPRTLFSLTISNMISWLPFFILMLVTIFLTSTPEWPTRILFLGTLWWGYTQSLITPVLIYLVSDRVNFFVNVACHKQTKRQKNFARRVRRFTLNQNDELENV